MYFSLPTATLPPAPARADRTAHATGRTTTPAPRRLSQTVPLTPPRAPLGRAR